MRGENVNRPISWGEFTKMYQKCWVNLGALEERLQVSWRNAASGERRKKLRRVGKKGRKHVGSLIDIFSSLRGTQLPYKQTVDKAQKVLAEIDTLDRRTRFRDEQT